MSGGIVIPFRPRPRAHPGLAIVLQVVDGKVELLCDQVKLVMPPEMARDLALDMIELAGDAEGGRDG